MKCTFCGLGESTTTGARGCGLCQVHRIDQMRQAISAQTLAAAAARGNQDLMNYRQQAQAAQQLGVQTSAFSAREIAAAQQPATPPARPVRVGDKVTWCGVVGVVTHVDQQGTAIEFPPRSGMYSSHYGWGWDGTHADGAPIDVEATLAELRGDRWRALESRPGFAVEITDQNRALQEANEHIADLQMQLGCIDFDRERLVVAEKRIVDLEAALKETERFAREENGRVGVLSDDLGALRTERDELAVENSRLRRTIERLERRGGKR